MDLPTSEFDDCITGIVCIEIAEAVFETKTDRELDAPEKGSLGCHPVEPMPGGGEEDLHDQ